MKLNNMEDINYSKARDFLLTTAPTLSTDVYFECLDNICDLNQIKQTIYTKLCNNFEHLQESYNNDETTREKFWLSLNCVIFNEIHETLLGKFYEKFAMEDEYFFQKSKILAELNVTAEQFGGNENHAIHFSAAVVELANLDCYKSPIEKFNCLSNAYDCIFAELKSVLIEFISKYSENEADIPIINNSEIRPVLMVVLVKSKLVHLISNLQYIEDFLWMNKQNDHIKYIMDSFKMATDDLMKVNEETIRPPSAEVCRNLDLMGVIEITSPQSNVDGVSVLKEQRNRVRDLIVCATNETNKYKCNVT